MLLKRISGAFILALVCAQLALGTNYYVDNSCANNGDGTTTTCGAAAAHGPFNSIANVQSAIMGDQHGNSVLLKSGETFREQYTVPANGTAAGQFTVSSYGAGPQPIITGANLVTSWTASTASGNVSQANMRISLDPTHPFLDFGAAGSLTPYKNGAITITDSASKTLTGTIRNAGTTETYGAELLPYPGMDNLAAFYFGGVTGLILSSGCQAGNCLQITLTSGYGAATQSFNITSGMLVKNSTYAKIGTETGLITWVVQDGTNFTSLSPPFYVNPSVWTQYVGYCTAISNAIYQFYGGQINGKTDLFDTSSSKQVLTPSATGVTMTWGTEQSGFNRNDPAGYSYAIASSNPYHASYSTAPNEVYEDGLPLAQNKTSVASLTPGQWFLDTGNKYIWVYTRDTDSPASHTMEAAIRPFCIYADTKDYVTVSGIEMDRANLYSLYIINSSNYWSVSNNTVLYPFSGGMISIYNPTNQNNQWFNNTIVGGTAGVFYATVGIRDWGTNHAGSIFNNNLSYLEFGVDLDIGDAPVSNINGGSVYGNSIANISCPQNHQSTDMDGIEMANGYATGGPGTGPGDYVIQNVGVFNNYINTSSAYAITCWMCDNVYIYGNIMLNGGFDKFTWQGQQVGAITAWYNGTNGIYAYGNTIYNWQNGIAVLAPWNGPLVAGNNIISTVANNGIWNSSGGITENYNDVYNCTGACFSGISQGANSITTDPLFSSVALSQLWLQSGSPARGAGTSLGAPYNIGIQPGASWPYNVFTTPNTNNDLGVFPYTGSVIDSVTGSGTQASGTTR